MPPVLMSLRIKYRTLNWMFIHWPMTVKKVNSMVKTKHLGRKICLICEAMGTSWLVLVLELAHREPIRIYEILESSKPIQSWGNLIFNRYWLLPIIRLRKLAQITVHTIQLRAVAQILTLLAIYRDTIPEVTALASKAAVALHKGEVERLKFQPMTLKELSTYHAKTK